MKQTPENRSDSLGQVTWLHRLPVIAGVLALLLIIGYVLTFKALPAGENPTAWGTFGDYMGGLLNPLISLFTLMVAMQVWTLQKTELLETRKAIEKQGKTAELQFQSSERARYEATYVSCRDDVIRAITTVADTSSTGEAASRTFVRDLSKQLEKTPPLIAINSHATSFACHAPGFETPRPIEAWDWAKSHGNDARETLRLMLPFCRAIGDMLVNVSSMPTEEKVEKFRRFRNSLDEWTLSTFAYFLVLHPDGPQYQTAATEAHVLVNLHIDRALSFAKAYLPEPTYSTPIQEQ